MCQPIAKTSNGGVAQKKKRRWPAVVMCALALYFAPAVFHTSRLAEPTTWRVKSPPNPMRIDILNSRITKLWLKRDGGLHLETLLEMRLHNDMPVAFRIRGINMTANFRMLGGDDLYTAGHQEIQGFAALPLGASLTTAVYVLDDLRPSMLLALARDSLRNNVLETHSVGHAKLWPAGVLDLKCVLTAPLGALSFPLSVVNTCQGKILA